MYNIVNVVMGYRNSPQLNVLNVTAQPQFQLEHRSHKVKRGVTSSNLHCLLVAVFTSSLNHCTIAHLLCQKWNTLKYSTTEAVGIALYSLVSAHNSFKSCFTACGSWPEKSTRFPPHFTTGHYSLFYPLVLELASECAAVVREAHQLCLQHQKPAEVAHTWLILVIINLRENKSYFSKNWKNVG